MKSRWPVSSLSAVSQCMNETYASQDCEMDWEFLYTASSDSSFAHYKIKTEKGPNDESAHSGHSIQWGNRNFLHPSEFWREQLQTFFTTATHGGKIKNLVNEIKPVSVPTIWQGVGRGSDVQVSWRFFGCGGFFQGPSDRFTLPRLSQNIPVSGITVRFSSRPCLLSVSPKEWCLYVKQTWNNHIEIVKQNKQ